jgi:rhodanese-related sulfurtransferase
MLKNGATVVDVRTAGEFAEGHVEGSVNIPLDQVPRRIEEIKAMHQPIVLCCVSGARSGRAMDILRAHGVTCSNAGGWMDVQRELGR